MSPRYYKSGNKFGDLLDSHGAEGISVLTSEPSGWMRAVILMLIAILLSAFIWSFIGKADVIVKATGTITPEEAQYRVQTPVKGELVDIYVAEGMPVLKGDLLARVYSPGAIGVATAAENSKNNYEASKREYDNFPVQKELRLRDLAIMKNQIEVGRKQQEKIEAESIAQLGEEQALKLQKARAKVLKAADERRLARSSLDSYERLFNSPGGGGISRQQLVEKRNDYRVKELDYETALAELGEFEVNLSKEYTKKQAEIHKSAQKLVALENQYETSMFQLEKDEVTIETNLRTSRATWLTNASVTFENIDENNNLRLRSPMDGIVTQLLVEQTGIQIEDKVPIMVLAPEGSRKILEVSIPEKDRAFLREGMPVKVKMNAFSYQRFGVLYGELEYISPGTTRDADSKQSVYTARIGLDRDHFDVKGEMIPIRFGMQASAEITVRKRRIIDIVLDPIRNIAG